MQATRDAAPAPSGGRSVASGAAAAATGRTEYDPLGEDAGTEDDYAVEEPDRDFPLHGLGVPSAPMNGCVIDGMPGDCETAVELVRAGGARMYFTYDPLPASPFYVNHENGHGGYRRWVRADPHRDRGAHWEFATLEAFGGFGPVGVRDPQNTAPPADRRTDCQR